MSHWLDRLQHALQANQIEHYRWQAGDGELLVTVPAARILGCSLPGAEGNLFWHNPSLEDPIQVPECFRLPALGGDRLWIAPEAGFIFTDVKKARKDPITHSELPPAMDPGDWRIASAGAGHLRLISQMTLTDRRTGKKVTLNVARQFDLIDRPAGLPKRIRCLSFAIRNELAYLENDPGVGAGTWDLLQLPPTGWLICPTTTPLRRAQSYFNPFGPRHVKFTSDAVRFLIDGKRRIKMGLPPEHITGRMGYFRKLNRHAVLILRIFHPQPGRPYVDVPLSSNAMMGTDALQAYNDDGTFGGFGEMEYHDPAVITGKEPTSQVGTSVTHVLLGSEKDIRTFGSALLGARI